MGTSTVAERMLWTSSTQVATFLRLVTEHEDAEAKRIGQLIAALRNKEGWSQQDLATKLGVHNSTVSRWERGEHESYAKNVQKLAKALKVPPSLLRPVAPDVETQLDRIEEMLERLLSKIDPEAELSPEAEADRVIEESEAELGEGDVGDLPGAA